MSRFCPKMSILAYFDVIVYFSFCFAMLLNSFYLISEIAVGYLFFYLFLIFISSLPNSFCPLPSGRTPQKCPPTGWTIGRPPVNSKAFLNWGCCSHLAHRMGSNSFDFFVCLEAGKFCQFFSFGLEGSSTRLFLLPCRGQKLNI